MLDILSRHGIFLLSVGDFFTYISFVPCWLGLLFSETKQKTLEEIAAAFGDKILLAENNDLGVDPAKFSKQHGEGEAQEVEVARKVVWICW
jgi:hypothetical protein